MTSETLIQLWTYTRETFYNKVEKLDEDQLSLSIGKANIGELIYHTADVEYIFLDWYFNKKIKHPWSKDIITDKKELLRFLDAAHSDLTETMKEISDEEWQVAAKTKMGECSKAEAIGRLIYHAGIHSGQMTDILNAHSND